MSRRLKQDVQRLAEIMSFQNLRHLVEVKEAGSVTVAIDGRKHFVLFYVDCDSYPRTSVLVSTVPRSSCNRPLRLKILDHCCQNEQNIWAELGSCVQHLMP